MPKEPLADDSNKVTVSQIAELLRQIEDGAITKEHIKSFLKGHNPFSANSNEEIPAMPVCEDDFELSLYRIIGERIKDARKAKKMDQNELAEHIHMSRASIYNIENSRHAITIAACYRIAEVLKLDIHQLLPTIEEVQAAAATFAHI